MNLLDARIAGGTVRLGETVLRDAPEGTREGPVTAGLRPESVRLIAGDGAGTFRLDYVEELGGSRLIHGHVAGQSVVCQVATDEPLHEVMDLQAAPGDVLLYDPETGRRIV